jgi:TldD protein
MTTMSNISGGTSRLETRHHELRRTRLSMVDGNLTGNLRSVQRGISARAYQGGYWGFAAATLAGSDGGARQRVQQRAVANAQALSRFGTRTPLPLGGGAESGEYRYAGKPALPAAECAGRLGELHAWVMQRYPTLRSARFIVADEDHTKQLETDDGARSTSSIQRALCYFTLIAEADDGTPVELSGEVSAKGNLADLDWSLEALAPRFDELHEHLQAKRQAVPARGGEHTVVLAAELAGMLAHEAMGHPCEADLVLAGAVTAGLLGQRVASDLVSMVDYAHTYDGHEVMVPVYIDDEGTPARDAVLIERGVLASFMQSRETAARLGQAPSGNARAYAPDDEPLIRMRNTAILPGTSALQEMIEGVDDGYLLLKTGNGEADSTTEFMFGINLAYEIRGGKIGRAVRDTTLSGSAIKVLQSVDAVGSEMYWTCSGYCGKKQRMVVSMGGPALRARAHLGGA